MADANAIVLRPTIPPGATEAQRRRALEHAADFAKALKLRELRAGKGVSGKPLVPVKPESRPDGATGAPLSPHEAASRSQRWLRATIGYQAGTVTLWWSHGWGRILNYHREGIRRKDMPGGKVYRDVIGLTEADRKKHDAEMNRWWKLRGIVATTKGTLEKEERHLPRKPVPAGTVEIEHYTHAVFHTRKPKPAGPAQPGDFVTGFYQFTAKPPRPPKPPKPPRPDRKAEEEARKRAEAAKARAEAEAEAEAKRKAEEAQRKATEARARAEAARPVGPVLPGRPIAERLAAYREGDRKVAALTALGQDLESRRAQLDALQHEKARLQDEFEKSGWKPGFPGAARLRALYEEIPARSREYRAELDRVHAEVVKVLAVDRPLVTEWKSVPPSAFTTGAGVPLTPLDDAARREAEAARAWLTRVVRGGARPEDALPVAVGQIDPTGEQRSYCADGGRILAMSGSSRASIYVHEFGHAIDYRMRAAAAPGATLAESEARIVERSREFLRHRVGDERPRPMHEVDPRAGYDAGETGRKDRFDQVFDEAGAYYCGKDYGASATEILSMGLQSLYENPTRLALRDPEYCKFVLGILDGSLR